MDNFKLDAEPSIETVVVPVRSKREILALEFVSQFGAKAYDILVDSEALTDSELFEIFSNDLSQSYLVACRDRFCQYLSDEQVLIYSRRILDRFTWLGKPLQYQQTFGYKELFNRAKSIPGADLSWYYETVERLYTPPTDSSIADETPLVFLAGPIQGADDWQGPLGESLIRARRDIAVASPRRYSEADFNYQEQVTWEKQHLARSAKFGTIAFWWAAQNPELPYEAGRAYAQTSRIEIGRIFGWHDHTDLNLVVGFEEDYTPNGGGNQRYIEEICKEKGLIVAHSINELESSILEITPQALRN